jgi:hypothetical protein
MLARPSDTRRLPQTGPGLRPPPTPINDNHPVGDTASFDWGGPPPSILDTDYMGEFDSATARPERRKDGDDWCVIWSSKSKKVLDVNLVHTLTHDTSVAKPYYSVKVLTSIIASFAVFASLRTANTWPLEPTESLRSSM